MLIIPLHQRLTLARFPWVTALLIAFNVIVYFGFQSRDESAYRNATDYYRSSGLVELEMPVLLQHLRARGRNDLVSDLQRMPEPQRSRTAVELQSVDPLLVTRLGQNPPFPASEREAFGRWRMQRAQLEQHLALAVTPKYLLLFHEPSVPRNLSSMFLHADAGHLLGNMLFLALLGLMTEAALGPWLFLGVYLLSGLGGAVVSSLRHFGEFGSALGASGAIAGLMGACCVIWGMRKIRVFYWAFIYFDYVRVPALALLPFWLGWELWHMWSSPNAGIGFDAHAGGIMTGALACFAIRKLGWERRDVLDEAADAPTVVDRYAQARSALGKLEFAAAREATARLIEEFPQDREAWRLRLRAWRDRPTDDQWHAAARQLLLGRLKPVAGLDEDIALYQEYLTASAGQTRLAEAEQAALGARWLQGGRLTAAERLTLSLLDAAEPAEDARRLALRLALAWHEAGDSTGFQRVGGRLYAKCPNSAETARLQRLLGEP